MRYSGAMRESLVSYLQKGEKSTGDYRVGVEFEHLILHKDSLKAVSFYEYQGIEDLFRELVLLGWTPVYEGKHLLQLKNDEATVALEPGGQVELSVQPQKSIRKIDLIYRRFLKEVIAILNRWDKIIVSIGYQPQSRLPEIPLLPKERYKYMFQYFNTRGRYAHNMMKGTASTQVSVDYSDEEDCVKKIRVASFLSPLVYCFFDNAPFFEGQVVLGSSLRNRIWDNCDSDRCGVMYKIFTPEFGYNCYAEYMLDIPPIIVKKDNRLLYTKGQPLKELFEVYTFSEEEEELGYLFSMFFFDVRLRNYIEIRMGDALPYPFSLGYAAFWKGLLYEPQNLETLYQESLAYEQELFFVLKKEIELRGTEARIGTKKLVDKLQELSASAEKGLCCEEKIYLRYIQELLANGLTPKKISLSNLHKGQKEALQWCILNDNEELKGRGDYIACC